ncbi:translocase of chloroplast 120, chloroplastic-like protein [Tanacetum coccineum]
MFLHLRTKSLVDQTNGARPGRKMENDGDSVQKLLDETELEVVLLIFSFERARALVSSWIAAESRTTRVFGLCTIWFLERVLGNGIKVRVIDTPGLLPFWADQRKNQKILQSVKKFIQKSPPDIVLYLDRSKWLQGTSYDSVTQRSHVVQQAIRQAAGDMRLMNPVSLVENHSACRTNQNGQRVLPNAARLATWKAVCSQKSNTTFTLHSVNSFGDDNDDALDDDIDESSDEETSEYDEFPPFKRLTNAHVSKLSKEEKKSYYDELEYREKLFMKKQLKEENNNVEEDNNHTHRYRVLDSANQWLIRPVLDPHGWDHDVGYEGINVEHLLALKEKITVSFSGQVTKDKKDANLQMEGGVKFEDKLMINKRGELVVAEGAVIARGDVAYGGSLEATLRDKDFPLCRFLSTIGYGLAWRSCTWVECSVPNSYDFAILLWLLDPRMDDGSQLIKDNAERTSSFVVLISLLKPLDPSSTIYEVDLDRILQSIHVYLQELGIEEIRRGVGARENDVHMLKTLLYELCKLCGTAIKGHLSMVPIDMEPQPIILAYIDLNLQTLAAARMLTPTGPTGQTHWGDSMANNPMPAAHSADA